MGGGAHLSLEDTEVRSIARLCAPSATVTPRTGAVSARHKDRAMPPMKRFRDMEQLSGGE